MIRLPNGHNVTYVVASGALAFDGRGWPWEKPLVWLGLIKPELFTVITKSLTLQPTRGNLRWWKPWSCVKLLPHGGAVNKVGLTNPGIGWWLRRVAPSIDFARYKIVVSIFGTADELVAMARMLDELPIVGIEVNASCPNTKNHEDEALGIIEAVRRVAKVSRHPVFVKVGVHQDYMTIAEELARVARGMSWNSVPWKLVFPGKTSPFEKLPGPGGGGVSGKPAQLYNWPAAQAVAFGTNMPVIFPSVMNETDVRKAWPLGAQAVAFGAIHLRTPWKPTAIVRKLTKATG